MKKYRSISIPEKLPSVKKDRSYHYQKRNEIPVFMSVKFTPQLMLLQKENLELRNRLKLFNDRLQVLIIENSKISSRPKKSPELDPNQNLQIVRKNLAYYENEFNRILARQKQLSDPNYEIELKQEIDVLKEKLTAHEDKKKKNEANQKLREKSLNTVLDTGEMAELHKEFTEFNAEISLYTKRFQKLEKLNTQTLTSYKDILEKTEEFNNDLKRLKELAGDYDDSKQKQLVEKKEKLNKKFSIVQVENKSKVKILNNKIKKLQDELEDLRHNQEDIEVKIDDLNRNIKINSDLVTGYFGNQNFTQRKIFSEEFMDDELMFLTEKIN